MRLLYSSRALAQLASIYLYLVERNPRAAFTVVASIRETVARLKYLPSLGRSTDEREVRVIIESQYAYRVFYRVDAERVIVIRIMHPSQQQA